MAQKVSKRNDELIRFEISLGANHWGRISYSFTSRQDDCAKAKRLEVVSLVYKPKFKVRD